MRTVWIARLARIIHRTRVIPVAQVDNQPRRRADGLSKILGVVTGPVGGVRAAAFKTPDIQQGAVRAGGGA